MENKDRIKIKVKNAVVEMTGDEMAFVIWKLIKNGIILPFLDIQIHEYDLSLPNRDKTNDEVTRVAAMAIKECGVGIKCATITHTDERVKEFNSPKMLPSPNGTIRNVLDGTVFREPIVIENVHPNVIKLLEAIIIARHSTGDQYKATEYDVTKKGTMYIKFVPEDGTEPIEIKVTTFDGPGVFMGMFNTDESIRKFCRSSFNMGLERKMPVYLATKNTILKIYDGRFVKIFQEIYDNEYADKFAALGIQHNKQGKAYEHKLIDDMAAKMMILPGNYLLALKNYDGDVFSDLMAAMFGSLGLMTSVLRTIDGKIVVAEAAHGTITAHFRRLQKILKSKGKLGNDISSNPIASIFAWTGGLRHRATLDENVELTMFCNVVELIIVNLVQNGIYTRDIAKLITGKEQPPRETWVTTYEFIDAIIERLPKELESALATLQPLL